jgi:predicted MPP superfamily phosphohydrolase
VRLAARAAAASVATAALAVSYMLIEAQAVRRVDLRLPAPGAHPDLDGLTIVQLSDFHAAFRPSLNLRATRKAIALALSAEPDLVVITGDFAGGVGGLDELSRQLHRLRPPLGIFGVLGNHDHGESKAPFVRAVDPSLIEGLGVRLLRNDCANVVRGAGSVQVCGVDDSDGGHDDLAAVAARLDRRPGVLRLLLSHHADMVLWTRPGDFDLVVGGDTHGGQICLPLPGRRIMLSDPSARFAEGAYDVAGRRLYVTRGIGTSLLPFRAFCRPEIVVYHVACGPA